VSTECLTIAGTLLVPDGPASVRLTRGHVRVAGATIESVTLADDLPDADFGGNGWFVCPGFVDAHLHVPQFDSIGAFGLELLDWLDRVIFPAETRWADADYAGAMGERVARELLSFGTTAVGAYGTVHAEGTAAAMRALASHGIAGVMGQSLMDRNAPHELTRPANELLEEAASAKRVGRLAPAITPRFAVSCTDELLKGAGMIASRTGQAVQTHIAETERECELIAELFDDLPYAEVYGRAGLLGERTILAHGIRLSGAERALIAQHRSVVAHCPTANLFLRAGEMDRAGHARAGVRLALGSDVAGGPDRSMVRVARAMLETAIRMGAEPPPAAAAWWQITGGNADALARPELARLAAGKDADLVVVRPTIRWHDAPDPLARLLWGWDDRWIERVIVAGKPIEPLAGTPAAHRT